MTPDIQAFFDDATNTVSYVVREPQGRACAIIDSVLDYDQASGRTDTKSADAIIAWIKSEDLQVACVPCVTKSSLDFQKATFPNLFHHGIIIHLCNTTGVLVRVNASVNCASNQRFVLGRDMPPQKPKEKI